MKPKKIILVVLDTLRADHLGCYGYSRDTSPNIDELSRECFFFKYAFSSCSYTMPSHASIFTGKYPNKHSVGFSNGPPVRPADNDISLAEVFSGSDYQTGAFVSSVVLSRENGGALIPGFKTWDDSMTAAELNRPDALLRPGKETNEAVIKWLEQHYKEDFFIFINYFDIHGPYEHPEPYKSMFLDNSLTDQPLYLDRVVPDFYPLRGIPDYQVLNPERNAENQLIGFEKNANYYHAQYDSGIRYADDCVMFLTQKLKALGIYEDTFIIITSDHGEAMGENDVWFFHGLTTTLDQIHVPLLIKPHKGLDIKPSVIWNHVSLIDIFPTLCSLIDFNCDGLDIDGKSILPYQGNAGKDNKGLYSRMFFAEIEGQTSYIDNLSVNITPKDVDSDALHYFYVEELCKMKREIHYRNHRRQGQRTSNQAFWNTLKGPFVTIQDTQRYAFLIELVNDKRVLDAPCGNGVGSSMLAESASSVIGLDEDDVFVESASSRYKRSNLNYVAGTTKTAFPLEQSIFDVVVHFDDQLDQAGFNEQILASKRLLSDLGILVIAISGQFSSANEEIPGVLKRNLSKLFANVHVFGQRFSPCVQLSPLPEEAVFCGDYISIEEDTKLSLKSMDSNNLESYIFIASNSNTHLRGLLKRSFLMEINDGLIGEAQKREAILKMILLDKSIEYLRFKSLIFEKDDNINKLEVALKNIYESTGWRILSKYYHLRETLLPEGSKKRQLLNFLFHRKWGASNH